jgi:hypothetical protein
MSVAIASNPALHEQIVNEVGSGLARLRALWGDAKTGSKP